MPGGWFFFFVIVAFIYFILMDVVERIKDDAYEEYLKKKRCGKDQGAG